MSPLLSSAYWSKQRPLTDVFTGPLSTPAIGHIPGVSLVPVPEGYKYSRSLCPLELSLSRPDYVIPPINISVLGAKHLKE